ncbi:MAG: phosphatase PAP2 family protein [Finegoldia sp.]|nr:phosphatase PAP2 family protein [Finegoldia sp.]
MTGKDYFILFLSLVFLLITVICGFKIFRKHETRLDRRIKYYFHKMDQNRFISFMKIITKFGNSLTIALINLPVGIYFALKEDYESLTAIITGIFTSFFIIHTLKFFFKRNRPKKFKGINYFGYSFPSAHSGVSMSTYVTVSYILSYNYQIFYPVITGAFILASLIALSRIVIAAHWFTDVVFGSVIGLLCAYWSIFLYRIGFSLF